ncbi:AMP-binding protein [Chloroflexota bacterium]
MSALRIVVGDLLDINTARSPYETALIDPANHITMPWIEWNTQAVSLANFLIENSIGHGDRVVTFLRDAIELPTSLFAVAKAGGIFVPVNYRLSPEELGYIVNDCAAKVLIFDEDGRQVVERIRDRLKSVEVFIYTGTESPKYATLFNDLINECKDIHREIPVSEDDVAAIMYTSGTTGRPKGTVHTHRGFLGAVTAWSQPAKITPLDRSLALGPLYHVGGLLSNFLPTLYMGGSNVIQRQFVPTDTLNWIKDHTITVIWATPTHLNMLASVEGVDEYDTSNLRAIQYSGAPLTLGLARKIRGIFSNVNLINAYGMTELDAVSALYPEEHDEHLGSVGRALPKTFVRIVAPGEADTDAEVSRNGVGEIIVKSPCVMREYWNLPDQTEKVLKNGWYFTGDLGKMDEDGYLFFMEREDDMIISGGENIYPLEVENYLSRHKKVRNVSVIGTPSEQWGEIVTALVIKADESLTEQELDEYCLKSDELATYKRPKTYIFVNELPTTSSGKVDKKLLRAQWVNN